MIERYVNEDVFNASERLILVPLPADETSFSEGFAGQVMKKYPHAAERVGNIGGLSEGGMIMVETYGGGEIQHPVHTLVLAGIHRRQEAGWVEAPRMLSSVLSILERQHADKQLATAGIPGTGFSGLRGGAEPEAIREVLDLSTIRVSVYQDGMAGDRAKVLHADPDREDHTMLTEA